jgi:hypothetical protein
MSKQEVLAMELSSDVQVQDTHVIDYLINEREQELLAQERRLKEELTAKEKEKEPILREVESALVAQITKKYEQKYLAAQEELELLAGKTEVSVSVDLRDLAAGWECRVTATLKSTQTQSNCRNMDSGAWFHDPILTSVRKEPIPADLRARLARDTQLGKEILNTKERLLDVKRELGNMDRFIRQARGAIAQVALSKTANGDQFIAACSAAIKRLSPESMLQITTTSPVTGKARRGKKR